MFQKTSLAEPLTWVKLYTDLHGTTTDEVNDLEAILILKHGRVPVVAAHDSEIQLHRDARRRQIELSN